MKARMAALLVRLYPVQWRNEYGPELLDVILRRPIALGTVLNVAAGAARIRVAHGQAWLFMGSVFLSYVLASIAMAIVHPPTYENRLPYTYLTYFLFSITGFLTPCAPGKAAVKTMLMGVWPVVVLFALNAAGVLGQFVLGPGDIPSTFAEHGWAFATYHPTRRSTSPFAMLFAPLFLIPYAMLWGGVGGWIARKLNVGKGARAGS